MSRFFVDHAEYLITVPTIRHRPVLASDRAKAIVLKRILQAQYTFSIDRMHFSIINNHYHLQLFLGTGEQIPSLMNDINGGSSFMINRSMDIDGPLWDEYHLVLLPNDATLNRAKGYVVGNPIKHGEVATFKQLELYPFSSYDRLIRDEDKEQAEALVRSAIAIDTPLSKSIHQRF